MIIGLFHKERVVRAAREGEASRVAIEAKLTDGCLWYVRGEAAREGVLTLENAKAYVRAYHTDLGCDRVDVEGCALISTFVRLNVTTHHPEHGMSAVQWDVWEEFPGVLYGEC